MFAACDACTKRYDVTGKRPGARFKCPACGKGSIAVPAAEDEVGLEALEELEVETESEAAVEPVSARPRSPAAKRVATSSASVGEPEKGAPRPKRTSTRESKARVEKKGANPLWIGVAAIVVLGGAAAYVLSSKKGDGGETPSVVTSSGAGTSSEKTTAPEGTASGAQVAAADPRAEYTARLAKLGKSDAAGRAALASFCDGAGMKSEARQLRREALLLDPAEETSRLALGFTRYEGVVPHLRGRWLDAKDLARAKDAEKYFSEGALAASATTHDVFVRRCEEEKRKWQSELPEESWYFAYGKEQMPQPFCVAIERPKDPEKLEEYRREYAEILSSLQDVFFERYQERFKLERDIEHVIRVMMFDSVQSYRKHVANHPTEYVPPDGIGGYYSDVKRLLVMWRGGMDIRQVLFHEGTHLLVHYAFSGRGFQPSNQTPWLQEGIAELFAGHKIVEETIAGVTRKKYVLNRFIPGRYGDYRMMSEGNLNISVLDLVRFGQYEFQDARKKQNGGGQEGALASIAVSRVYAFGWVLCMYLNHAENGRLRSVLDDYLEAETKGEGYWQKLGELLGLKSDADWEAFDAKVRAWAKDELPKYK